jgi:hypothetical protein
MDLALPVAAAAVGLTTDGHEISLTQEDVGLLRETLLPEISKKRRERFERRRLKVGGRWAWCSTANQARAVAAYWLAGQATTRTRALMLRLVDTHPDGGMRIDRDQKTYEYLSPYGPLYSESAPADFWKLRWSDLDFLYAADLVRRSDSEVGRVLRDRWGGIIDPDTETKVILSQFDLQALPSFEQRIGQLEERDFEPRYEIEFEPLDAGPPCR